MNAITGVNYQRPWYAHFLGELGHGNNSVLLGQVALPLVELLLAAVNVHPE